MFHIVMVSILHYLGAKLQKVERRTKQIHLFFLPNTGKFVFLPQTYKNIQQNQRKNTEKQVGVLLGALFLIFFYLSHDPKK